MTSGVDKLGRESGVKMLARATAMIVFLVLGVALSGGAWWLVLRESLTRLEDRGGADLALAGDRLSGQLERYRELAVVMAEHPMVLQALAIGTVTDAPIPVLQRTADVTGLYELLLVSGTGLVLGSSRKDTDTDLSATSSFHRAMQGALGFHHEIDGKTGLRLFIYAAPIFSPDGPVLGALVVRVATEEVEAAWRGEPMVLFFTDKDGLAFVSNRDEILLTRHGAFVNIPSDRVVPHKTRKLAGHVLWQIDGGPYLPNQALHLSKGLPVIEMTAEALVDTGPALRQAMIQAVLVGLAYIGVGATMLALHERRRALSVRLAAEAEANIRLETRVIERTQELSAANEQLRRAQRDLVQAGKLSALGEMSAGISHELNQPLMAIRTYAENAGLFLQRGQTEQVVDNLGRISDLGRRMGRIIKNLRAFARQENEGMSDVDLVRVIDDALELTQTRLANAGVSVDWPGGAGPAMVRGGEVRLQQVVVNLLSNAADAMTGVTRQITIRLFRLPGKVRLSVADTGTGIADAERMFDPFYTTKEVGAAEGMGLGLSITYGIVQSFGGAIAGRNRPEGGAEFTVDLIAAEGEKSA